VTTKNGILGLLLNGAESSTERGGVEAPPPGASVPPPPPDMTLNPREMAIAEQVIQALHLDITPADYLALPIHATIDNSRPGQLAQMQTPQGIVEMVMVPLVVAIPYANLKTSKVLLANGQMPDPLLGMLPVFEARMVVPKTCLKPEVLAAMESADHGHN
jgi:hypothetical protein